MLLKLPWVRSSCFCWNLGLFDFDILVFIQPLLFFISFYFTISVAPMLPPDLIYPKIWSGSKSDVVISRSGPKKLNINSAVTVEGTMDVKGTMNVKALKVNGKTFAGCQCSGGGGSVVAPIKEGCGSGCKACSKAKIWADGALCKTYFDNFG